MRLALTMANTTTRTGRRLERGLDRPAEAATRRKLFHADGRGGVHAARPIP